MTSLMKKTCTAAGAVILGVGILTVGGASPAAADSCIKVKGSPYDGITQWPVGYDGYAQWAAYGDRLRVVDTSSNGRRVVARLGICMNGSWQALRSYDSGPNEGATDVETYSLNLAEWRQIRFKVCERTSSGALVRCSSSYAFSHA